MTFRTDDDDNNDDSYYEATSLDKPPSVNAKLLQNRVTFTVF